MGNALFPSKVAYAKHEALTSLRLCESRQAFLGCKLRDTEKNGVVLQTGLTMLLRPQG